MMFTSKITNDFDFDGNAAAGAVVVVVRNRHRALNLCQFNCAINERETQTSYQIMCIFVEHNISVSTTPKIKVF